MCFAESVRSTGAGKVAGFLRIDVRRLSNPTVTRPASDDESALDARFQAGVEGERVSDLRIRAR